MQPAVIRPRRVQSWLGVCWHPTGLTPFSPGSLADDLLLRLQPVILVKERISAIQLSALFCGPRGIRTLGLLNAIETRSQLRYGPIFGCHAAFCPGGVWKALSGPEGIRTPGLLSAIEARSQLRYRPLWTVAKILHQERTNVNSMCWC